MSKSEKQFQLNLKKKNTGALAKYIMANAPKDLTLDIDAILRDGFVCTPDTQWTDAESVVIRARKIYNRFPGRVSLVVIKEIFSQSGSIWRLAHLFKYFPEIKLDRQDLEKFAEAFRKDNGDGSNFEKRVRWADNVLRDNPDVQNLLNNTEIMDIFNTYRLLED